MAKTNKAAATITTGSVTKVSRKNALRFLANKTGTAGTGSKEGSLEASVAERAYCIYLEEGRPEGKHLDHWLRAESELRA
jgi:hypothetical protein